jgi:hypothetical protein
MVPTHAARREISGRKSPHKGPVAILKSIIFVRLAHDRRFVGAVLFFVPFVFVLFIRVAGSSRGPVRSPDL